MGDEEKERKMFGGNMSLVFNVRIYGDCETSSCRGPVVNHQLFDRVTLEVAL